MVGVECGVGVVVSAVKGGDVPSVAFGVVGVDGDGFAVVDEVLAVVVVANTEVCAELLAFAVFERVNDAGGGVCHWFCSVVSSVEEWLLLQVRVTGHAQVGVGSGDDEVLFGGHVAVRASCVSSFGCHCECRGGVC